MRVLRGTMLLSMSSVVEHADGKMEVLYYQQFLERLGELNRPRNRAEIAPAKAHSEAMAS